jgi:cytochrome P450
MDRVAAADAEIRGYRIPKGTQLSLNVYASQRAPFIWENPTVFDPARFLPNVETGAGPADGGPLEGSQRPASGSSHFLAFGFGTRSCPGMQLSLMEQRVTLALLLQTFTWRLPPDSPHRDKLLLRDTSLLSPVDLLLSIEIRNRL